MFQASPSPPTLQPPPTHHASRLVAERLGEQAATWSTDCLRTNKVGVIDPDHQMAPGMSKGITPWHPNKLSLKQQ